MAAGLANNRGTAGLGRLGGKTLAWYHSATTPAVRVGLLAVNLIQPGVKDGQPRRGSVCPPKPGTVMEKVAGRDSGDQVAIPLRMVPPDVVSAAEAIGLTLATDRVLDMARTSVIVFPMPAAWWSSPVRREAPPLSRRWRAGRHTPAGRRGPDCHGRHPELSFPHG